ARGLAARPAPAQRRPRRGGRVLDLPRHLAPRRAAREGMGAALRDARVATPPRPVELARELAVNRSQSLADEVRGQLEGAPRGLPRLLAEIPQQGGMSLREHLEVHGEAPHFERRRREEGPLISRVERAGLRGPGGDGFPRAATVRAAATARGRAVVVVNIAEGEPASMKDRTLAQALPHLVLDGAELAADAVGAGELIVCVCESAPASVDGVAGALEERFASSRARPRTQLLPVPGTYVAGQ